MKYLVFPLFLTFIAGAAFAQETNTVDATAQTAFKGVPFTEVHFDDAFWSPRLKTNREISIPHNYKWCEDTGRFSNFANAAKLLKGETHGDFKGIFFNDSDVYKVLEGTAYSLADHPDAELEKRADDVIAKIAAAQQPNGYLNSYYTLKEQDKKWTDFDRHELYCAGHLIEAAVAYKRATDKDTLLNVTEKFVDHIIDVFITNKTAKFGVPGHEEIELALVKLYQLTGKEKYLDLSKHFIDARGYKTLQPNKPDSLYYQDNKPIRKLDEIDGHAVRAVYYVAGATDIAAYTGDKKLLDALDRLWDNTVNKKMYITGGIGARHEGEAFGEAYELPNRTAYCETCAAIGLVFWAQRMNLLHGDAKYADVVERAIYNGVLSGIGMDGKSFFYVNPLESTGNHHRQPFFDCACCPTNVVRFAPSLPGYQYAVDKDGALVVNQFVTGTATVQLPDGEVKIEMKTNYPWDGNYEILLTPKRKAGASAEKYEFRVRQGTFYDKNEAAWNVPHRYTSEVKLDTKRIIANPKVVADLGRVSIQRGPVVYCFEQIDNEVPVAQIKLPRDPQFTEEFRKDLLGGVVVIKCKNADGKELTAVPYYAWDSRQAGAMAVWVKQQGLSKSKPVDTGNSLYTELKSEMLSSTEDEPEPEITASFCHSSDALEAVIDGIEPKNSIDHDIPRMTFWDHKGTAEWLELDFSKVQKVSQISIYWFDDTGKGQCRVPKSWTLSHRDGDAWKPIKTTSAFGVEKDKYNTVEFEEIETKALRIDIQLQDGVSGGVLEWKTK
ncbi:hypothetical protein FACS1894170_04360 [Planctomycetales bacterium]|nr:hypothetical protein FACS1894170_04360 [Planctomycetales bacterium]